MVIKVFGSLGNKNKTNLNFRFNNCIMKLNSLTKFETNLKQKIALFFFPKPLVTKNPVSKKHNGDLSLWVWCLSQFPQPQSGCKFQNSINFKVNPLGHRD